MRLVIQDTSTATVAGATVTGPVDLVVDQATVGTETYGRGVVVVTGSSATRVAEMTEAGQWSLLAMIFGGLFAGVWTAKQWIYRTLVFCAFVTPAFADYTKHAQSQSIINPSADLVKKRVSVYHAVTTTGSSTTVHRTTGGTYNSPAISTVRRVYLRRHEGNGGSGTIFQETRMADTVANTSTPYDVPQYDRATAHSWTIWYTNNVNDSTVNQQFSSSGQNSSLVTVPGVTTTTRGSLEKQWVIEVAPKGIAVVNVERDFPFFLVIENATAYLDGEGVYHEEWEEEDEFTSTSSTVVAGGVTTAPHETRTEAQPTDFSSGPDPTPVTRPSDVSTNTGMNTAAEARHTESQGLLKDIKEGTDAGVGVAANAATQAAKDAATTQGKLDALAAGDGDGVGDGPAADVSGTEGDPLGTEGAAKKDGIIDGMSDLSDAVSGLAGSWSLGVSEAEYPVLNFPKPSLLGGGTVQMDFAAIGGWLSILRAILLVVVVWQFLSASLETIRTAV